MVLALLLCGLLGFLGVHRFYAGKIATGILQLLIMLGVVAWVLVDFPYRNGGLRIGLALVQLLALFTANLWPVLDFYLLLAGKFKDGEGKRIVE